MNMTNDLNLYVVKAGDALGVARQSTGYSSYLFVNTDNVS